MKLHEIICELFHCHDIELYHTHFERSCWLINHCFIFFRYSLFQVSCCTPYNYYDPSLVLIGSGSFVTLTAVRRFCSAFDPSWIPYQSSWSKIRIFLIISEQTDATGTGMPSLRHSTKIPRQSRRKGRGTTSEIIWPLCTSSTWRINGTGRSMKVTNPF